MIEKKKVGDEAKADDNDAVLDEDLIQSNKSPEVQETGVKLGGGDEDDNSKVGCQLGCCHPQLQPPANRFPVLKFVRLKENLLRILPREPQRETVENSATAALAPSISVMSASCLTKIIFRPQKMAT